MQPVGANVRTVSVFVGILGAFLCLGFLDTLIKWQVWEGALPPPRSRDTSGLLAQYCILFSCLWVSVWLLVLSWRDYVMTTRGLHIRRLEPVVENGIRAALEDKDFLLAIHLYRSAVPEAGRAEASDYALRIAAELRERDPVKFTAKIKTPANPRTVTGSGIYLPKSNSAWGYFPGATLGGRIVLTQP